MTQNALQGLDPSFLWNRWQTHNVNRSLVHFRRKNNSLRGSGGGLIETTTWPKRSKSQSKSWVIWDLRLCILFTSWWDFWQYNSLVIFSSIWNIAMIFSPCSIDIPLFLWWFCNSFPQCLTFGIEHHRPGIFQSFPHFLSHCTFWVFIQKRPLYLLGPNVHLASFMPIYIGLWLLHERYENTLSISWDIWN